MHRAGERNPFAVVSGESEEIDAVGRLAEREDEDGATGFPGRSCRSFLKTAFRMEMGPVASAG